MVVRDEFELAAARGFKRQKSEPLASETHYDPARDRVVVHLNSGVELAFPPQIVEGLSQATPADLGEIEISPSGFGLHWPRLDADIYLPGLLEGVFGSRRWMASHLGAQGGRAKTTVKTAASRENGKRGGRPKKQAANG
jgi:hypothetical protein